MRSQFPKGFRQNCLFHFISDSETAIENLIRVLAKECPRRNHIIVIRTLYEGGFKISCLYCKTLNIIYSLDTDYIHPLSQPCPPQDNVLSAFKCIACRQWTKYYWDKQHNSDSAHIDKYKQFI